MSVPTLRKRWARRLLYLALPLLGVAYQISAKETSRAMGDQPFDIHWLLLALTLHWTWALIVFEIIAFIVWMMVLSEIRLSEAFPLSALSYVFVVLASWIFYEEPGSLLQVCGGAAILTGVWLMGRSMDHEQ